MSLAATFQLYWPARFLVQPHAIFTATETGFLGFTRVVLFLILLVEGPKTRGREQCSRRPPRLASTKSHYDAHHLDERGESDVG